MAGYRIELEPDDDTLMVICPALPEVATFGEDEADARRHAVDAIEEALAARIADGRDLPPFEDGADVVRLPLLTLLKAALYSELRRQGLTRADLVRRLDWKRESVDRLFRLDHASRLDQIEAAMAALGREVDLVVREAA
ncbi:type II toxin-antitoxin system HicB family antitoxin [Methylobacterium nodulans]|uniref:HicB-like antitoxin of toxin-antitoxin system domain-containing protein n=1 Tax=Methylobacterium nodulans (strain LMG 21967 / CNCM I-2342 / ORS 2060) TaxID=460265 RepID=B8IEU4_METNO|nr:type II toxin-antitoxin system HicB family antitoxin [Methylobacterium nodulans]ACL61437.1 protein of unknown function UPF0150 [Methylobacterium nodulans ORS 2060]